MLPRVVLIALCAVAVFGQTPPAAPPPSPTTTPTPIRVEVKEVIVPVTVTDDKDRFVSNLTAKDFKIFDEGRPQAIHFFTHESYQPVVVGLLIDLSNANRLHWKTYQEAAIDLVLTLMPGGDKRFSGYLISYANDAELQVNTTTDPEKIVDKIRKMKPGGGAALFDSIYLACTRRDLVKGEPIEPRRVLVIIGDGHDNASKKTMAEVLEIAQRNLVTIYAVSTVAFGFTSEGTGNLSKLTEDTGGRVEYPLQSLYKDVAGFLSTPSDEGNYAYKVGTGAYAAEIASGMFKAIAAVAGEVTTQYILRYIPDYTDTTRRFRNIHVEVGLSNVKVRARKGYYPFAP